MKWNMNSQKREIFAGDENGGKFWGELIGYFGDAALMIMKGRNTLWIVKIYFSENYGRFW